MSWISGPRPLVSQTKSMVLVLGPSPLVQGPSSLVLVRRGHWPWPVSVANGYGRWPGPVTMTLAKAPGHSSWPLAMVTGHGHWPSIAMARRHGQGPMACMSRRELCCGRLVAPNLVQFGSPCPNKAELFARSLIAESSIFVFFAFVWICMFFLKCLSNPPKVF